MQQITAEPIPSKYGDWLSAKTDAIGNRLIWKFAKPSLSMRLPFPIVSFTFDDFPETAATNGAGVLEEAGVRGTFYVSGSKAGGMHDGQKMASAENCKELVKRGHELGCHTFSHQKLRRLGKRELEGELNANRKFLNDVGVTSKEVNFAFPYNAAWPGSRSLLRRHFATCRAAGENVNTDLIDPLMLKAVEIHADRDIKTHLKPWIDRVVSSKGWLIFFSHDVQDNPSPFGCSTAVLRELVSSAIGKGCHILPVRDALTLISE